MTSSGQADEPGATAIRAVVAQVVAQEAENELFVVTALEALDDEEVVHRLTARGGRRKPLAFDVDAAQAAVTSLVWIALTEAVRRLTDKGIDGIGKAKRRRTLLGRRREPVPTVVPPLTREQLANVKAHIVEAAREAHLSESRADAIAQATVSKLVLAPTESEQEPATEPTP